MARRVYFASLREWARKNWKNISASAAALGTSVGLVFFYLASIGAITINGYSGDSVCAGTTVDPCYAYINFTANEDVYLYPATYDPWGRNTTFDFNPNVQSWKLQRKWGSYWRDLPLNQSCTGTWCGAPSSDSSVKYSVAFRKGKSYEIRIVALKHDPTQTIKWSAFDGKVDPYWKAINASYVFNKLEKNDAGKGEAVFQMSNTVPVNPRDINISFNNKCGVIKSYDLLVEKNCTKEIPTYKKKYVCRQVNISFSNSTSEEKNKNYCYQEDVISGYENVTSKCYEKPTNKELLNQKYNLKVNIEPQVCNGTLKYAVDWIPSINKYSLPLIMKEWAWFNSSWTRRVPIEINSSENLYDYQVKLVVPYDADMQSDFDDLRFTDENDVILDYWIQNVSSSSKAIVWVKTNLSTSNGTQIYMYYGNPTIGNNSNGTNTFLLFDDFEGSFDSSKWYNGTDTGGMVRQKNGYLELYNRGYVKTNNRFNVTSTVGIQSNMLWNAVVPRGGYGFIHFYDRLDNLNGKWALNAHYSYNRNELLLRTSDNGYNFYPGNNYITSGYTNWTSYYFDNKQGLNLTGANGGTASRSHNTDLQMFKYSINVGYYDYPLSRIYWMFLRNYYLPEPTIALGSEQQNYGSLSINLSYGPPGTSVFRFEDCGPGFENSSAQPQGQNITYGIDYVCNNGTGGSGDLQVKLSNSLNTGWTWYASNTSASSNLVAITTSYQTIYHSLAQDACTYIWHVANCSYVTQAPGAYEQYNIQ